MKLLLWFPLVVAILQYHISVGAEQEVEENALVAFKNELMESETVQKVALASLIIVVSGTLIGLFALYPILLLITLIAAWIIASGLMTLLLWTAAHGGPYQRFLPFENISESVDFYVKSLVILPIMFIGSLFALPLLPLIGIYDFIHDNIVEPYLIEESY